jgi:hypothetical protein
VTTATSESQRDNIAREDFPDSALRGSAHHENNQTGLLIAFGQERADRAKVMCSSRQTSRAKGV